MNYIKTIFACMMIMFAINANAEGYRPSFSTAGFYEVPESGREVYSMNVAWRFFKGKINEGAYAVDFDDSKWNRVTLPHGTEHLPEESSGGMNYQGESWYRKHFTADPSLKGKKLFIHFEGIMGKSKVWINGVFVKDFFGGYLPVIADITNHIKWDSDNVIAVLADNSDDPMYPVGKSQNGLDFTYFGGIYRDCWLVAHNSVYITNSNYEDEIAGGGLFVSYDKVSQERARVNLKTHIRNETNKNFPANVLYELHDKEGNVVAKTQQRVVAKRGNAVYSTKGFDIKNPNLWSPENPYLYNLYVYVKDNEGKTVDAIRQRIGIRSIEFKQSEGLWINGKPYGKIMGTNRHQDFAIVGNAMPNVLQWRDAKKLRDAGLKVIRTHYVIDPAFMDACDELGIFALVETPGWQFWNKEPIFAERVYSDIRNMIRIHRNHASLFFWEPVLNETHYPATFAKQAKEICDEEYPYPYSIAASDQASQGDQYYDLLLRPIMDKLQPDKTYFVREWGDNVDDWSAHNSDSRVHLSWGENPMLIQSRHYEDGYKYFYSSPSQVVGACFWHSFDHQRGYHPDPFYGGIMDAFRQPKLSYYMFMSQRETDKRDIIAESGPMIYIAHSFTPFSSDDITIYSNCDEVRLTIFEAGEQITLKKETNKGLPSPSFVFKNTFDHMKWKAMARSGKQNQYFVLAEGLIDGKVVVSEKKYPSARPDKIRLRIDDSGAPSVANGSDVVTIIAEVVDKRGVVKRLNNSEIQFSIEGEGRLIGKTDAKIAWGTAPILIQSTLKAGKIRVVASLIHPGSQRPLEGELIFETVKNKEKEIYSMEDAAKVNIYNPVATNKATSKSDLEKENETLRRKLNEVMLKEVERQQIEFGVGIND